MARGYGFTTVRLDSQWVLGGSGAGDRLTAPHLDRCQFRSDARYGVNASAIAALSPKPSARSPEVRLHLKGLRMSAAAILASRETDPDLGSPF